MSAEVVEIDDRTQVDFIINGKVFNVCIRSGRLQIRADGRIAIFPEAANAVDVDVIEYSQTKK